MACLIVASSILIEASELNNKFFRTSVMDKFNEITALDKLLISIKSEGCECIADEASHSLIVIDTDENPHECWNASNDETVNVCVPMTIDDAVKYFKNPSALSFIEKDPGYDKSYEVQ